MKRTLVLTLTALLALAPAVRAQELVRIGAAAAVTGKVTAVDPLEQKKASPAGRILSSGKTLYSLDKVVSDKEGRLQVMLLDETVFTLGPNTEMILDEFVYDPFTDTGKVTARVTKGVFRFVTGKVARKDPENMKIKLPVGTIGIRGTIGGGFTDGKIAVAAFYGPGANNDTGDKPAGVFFQNIPTTPGTPPAQTDLNQPNTGSVIAGMGATPTPAFDLKDLGKMVAAAAAEAGGKKDDKEEKKDDAGAGSAGGTEGSGSGESAPSLDTTPPPPETGGAGGSGGAGDGAGATGGGGGYTPPEGEATGDAAGAGTGDTLSSLGDTGSIGDLAADANQTVTQQSQQASSIVDGTAKWDQLRSNESGGTGYFSGSGSYSCTGVCAGSGGGGAVSYGLNICFLTKTYAFAGSNPNEVRFNGGGLNGTAVGITPTQSFPLSGDAVITLQNGVNSNNSAFNGTTLSIINSGGVQATGLNLNLQYSGGGSTAQGTGTATYTKN